VIQRVLQLGFHAFFVDVDVVLLKDPLPWLRHANAADVQASLNYDDRPDAPRLGHPLPDLNTGVMHVKSNERTRQAVGEWAARTWARDRCPRRPPLWACGDQEQLTRLLHECGFTSPSYEAAAKLDANLLQTVTCRPRQIGTLRVAVLPPRLFASGMSSRLWSHTGRPTSMVSADVFSLHPNFLGFSAGGKKAKLKSLRLESSGRSLWCKT